MFGFDDCIGRSANYLTELLGVRDCRFSMYCGLAKAGGVQDIAIRVARDLV